MWNSTWKNIKQNINYIKRKTHSKNKQKKARKTITTLLKPLVQGMICSCEILMYMAKHIHKTFGRAQHPHAVWNFLCLNYIYKTSTSQRGQHYNELNKGMKTMRKTMCLMFCYLRFVCCMCGYILEVRYKRRYCQTIIAFPRLLLSPCTDKSGKY